MYQIRKSGFRLLKIGINIYTIGFFVVLIMLSAGGFPANAVEISKGGRILIKKTDLPENAEMKSVSISPDSNEVAVATKKSVYVISLSKSGGFHRIYDEGSDIRQISYSNTGKFLSVSDGKKSGYYDFSGKKMIVFPIDYYYDGPSGLYFSDLDTYLIVAATTKDVGHEILLIKTSDGKIYNRFFHLIPRHISCIEKKKMLVTLRRKDLSVYNIEKLGKPVFQRKFSTYLSKLPPFHKNLSLCRSLTSGGKWIIVSNNDVLVKIDFYGKNKPIFKKIDQWFFLLQFKEIRDCQVVAFGGFRELNDEKGQIRLFDYEKMIYISKNIPVEYLYDISPSYKFIVYLWDGDLKIKSLAEYLK